MVLATMQPWRSSEKGDRSLRLAEARDYPAAEHAARDAKDLNPLSVEPYFDLAAIAEKRGDQAAALTDLQRSVQLEPSNAEAWQRLGDLYLYSRQDPVNAQRVLRAALFLDPLSVPARASFLTALRAEQVLKARAAQSRKASSRRKYAGKGRGR